jgi:hypothetical protein
MIRNFYKSKKNILKTRGTFVPKSVKLDQKGGGLLLVRRILPNFGL